MVGYYGNNDDNLNRRMEINQITSEMRNQSYRRKVDMLEIEIAKATDPATRQRLQNMLDETLAKRKKENNVAFVFGILMLIAVLVVAGFIFFWYLPSQETNNGNNSNNVAQMANSFQTSDTIPKNFDENEQVNSDSKDNPNVLSNEQDSQTSQHSKSETGITVNQFKHWVAEVWNQKNSGTNEADLLNNPKLTVTTSIDPDGYAIASIAIVQSDTIDIYRINENNQLEESGHFAGSSDNWVLVSNELPNDLKNSARSTPQELNPQPQQDNGNTDHERAEMIRNTMDKNQGLDRDVLNSISDDEILSLSVGNATNSAIAETANNLIARYPNLKK